VGVGRRGARRFSGRVIPLAIFVVLAVGAGTTAAESSAPNSLSCAQLNGIVSSARDTFSHDNFPKAPDFPGVAVAVAMPAGVSGTPRSCTYEFGKSDYRTGAAVTAQTQFEIASLTKIFTAALYANALQQRKMKASDLVRKYLPAGDTAPACGGNRMNVGELANHRSGLPLDPSGYVLSTHAGYTVSQLFGALKAAHLASCPGTGWLYSDFGFGLLGQLVLRAQHASVGNTAKSQGQAFGNLVAGTITRPLHMGETELEPLGPDSRLATGYHSVGHSAPRWDNLGAMAPGGGLVSSIADMSNFLTAALGNGPSAVVKLLAATEQRVAAGPQGRFQMGLAWQIYTQSWYPAPYMVKFGGSAGMHSVIVIAPKLHTGIVILTNGPASPLYPAELILHSITPHSGNPPRPGANPPGATG
jgi:D-alanyl-D-alanine-carboxypeptidase/D-alanyl-D-alanine-endopeptidase